uniref:Uncharacterized protein n=1 Tax=Octactis speculum TaxID=3111310 RepID=A0A7S2CR77_9STRA
MGLCRRSHRVPNGRLNKKSMEKNIQIGMIRKHMRTVLLYPSPEENKTRAWEGGEEGSEAPRMRATMSTLGEWGEEGGGEGCHVAVWASDRCHPSLHFGFRHQMVPLLCTSLSCHLRYCFGHSGYPDRVS